jgi:hypothetical protein
MQWKLCFAQRLNRLGGYYIRFIAVLSALGAMCPWVVAASRVIVGADFVPSSGEGIFGPEVVKAIACSNPRAIQLPRNPVGGVSFVVVREHVLRLHHQVVVDAGKHWEAAFAWIVPEVSCGY